MGASDHDLELPGVTHPGQRTAQDGHESGHHGVARAQNHRVLGLSAGADPVRLIIEGDKVFLGLRDEERLFLQDRPVQCLQR